MFLPYKGADGHPDLLGFGDGQKAFFWLKQGKPDPASIHWGFVAENNQAVDAFYKAAIAAGAKDNISPRARLEYYPGYYAAVYLIQMATRLKWFTRASFGVQANKYCKAPTLKNEAQPDRAECIFENKLSAHE